MRGCSLTYSATNGASRLSQVISPMGKRLRYDYTFRGGLEWRQDGNGRITKYQYDPLGRLIRVTDADENPLMEMAYDGLGKLTRVPRPLRSPRRCELWRFHC